MPTAIVNTVVREIWPPRDPLAAADSPRYHSSKSAVCGHSRGANAFMRKNTGHIIRISGLVIEMLGLYGMYNSTGANDQAQLTLPGGTVVSLAWMAVGIGFVLWLIGTLLVYVVRPNRKPVHKDQLEPPF